MSGLLEGLDASIVSRSALPEDNPKLRLDAQFQGRGARHAIEKILALPHCRIGDLSVKSLKGRAIPYDEEGDFPVIRSGDITNFFQATKLLRSTARSEAFFLQKNDVLISSIGQGSIGKVQLFTSSDEFATVSEVTVVRSKKASPAFVSAFLSSSFGQAQIERYVTGATGQLHLYPLDVDRILIPQLSEGFQRRIKYIYETFEREFQSSLTRINSAQTVLLGQLGLQGWTPPEPLSFTARSGEALAAGRLDSRFFSPRIQALLDTLVADGRKVSDVARPRREKFRADTCAAFDYIEISDIDGAGAASSSRLAAEEAPSRATWHVRADDIITSTVRPIRQLSAQITPDQDGFVCSSGFVVVTPHDIPPEVLLTYLRLPVICELLDLYASASMYPAITDADIFNLPMPRVPNAVAEAITQNVQAARLARASASNMLDAAKHAVEVAIETDELRAMAYLNQLEGAI